MQCQSFHKSDTTPIVSVTVSHTWLRMRKWCNMSERNAADFLPLVFFIVQEGGGGEAAMVEGQH